MNRLVDELLDEEQAAFEHEPVVDEARRDALAKALRERFDMAEDDAFEVATVVVSQFGESSEVNDETLDPTVRSIFYTLEAKKLLSFRREEYVWENGEKRRGFWWRLRDEELAPKSIEIPVQSAEEDVYASLPKDVWTARQNA
ncbi:MAG TPA: DUF6015 family protein [Candidatus Thermoplasmatota archaeon]|nr:DUF6015 family protein [Candidatus Thermoplasmatota archaeon]